MQHAPHNTRASQQTPTSPLPRRRWASVLALLLVMLVTFGFLLTAAERFFCPSLEFIADRLKLSPAVAGATLLSFGNGAPDVFTQLAAVRQVRRGRRRCVGAGCRAAAAAA
jgi:Ca2+/Na+ antiporter